MSDDATAKAVAFAAQAAGIASIAATDFAV